MPTGMPPLTPSGRHGSSVPSSPVKSILRRPSVLGRRKSVDRDEMEDSTQQTKRRKVLFNEIGNSVHVIGQGEAKRQVVKALEEHRRGEDEDYLKLKECFDNDRRPSSAGTDGDNGDALNPHELRDYVIALTNCAQMLKHREYNDLVRQVLGMSWLGRDEDFLKAYIQFLAALVSSQGSYLSSVLTMIVNKFRDSRAAAWDVADYPSVDRQTMRERLHVCLQYIQQLFPAARAVLRNIIANKLPYSNESVRTHMAYVDNLLRLKQYVPDMAEDIMDLIIGHVVKIDVQMQVDLEDVDDDVASSVAYLLKNTENAGSWEDEHDDDDDDEDDSDADSVASDDSDYDPKAEKIKAVKSSVEKMDAILDTLFELYSRQLASPDSDEGIRNFTILVRQFTEIILPTYKSRHTQFLLFHAGQLSERLIDAFCGTCISIAFQSNRPNIVRQAAAAYLASFVARGAHLPSEVVRTVFGVLLHHTDSLRESYEPRCRGPDIKKYHTYYALCQAVFYIYCFRWKDLVVTNDEAVDPEDPSSYLGQDLGWLPNMKELLSRNIYSKLNPMKVCAPSIVEEFAKMAHRLNLIYIFPLLASNKRIRLSQFISDTYSSGGALRDVGEAAQDESYHQLDPYFPFDPYQLPVSKRWLETDYLDWQPIPGLTVDEDDDSDNGEDAQDDEEIEEEGTATDSDVEDD
jgi:RNA polymerase I-specific transcription initiation factor RRN3